jgi:hypothetical protein
MTSKASEFIGNIPENYDNGLGPRIFFDYAEDLSRRVAAYDPESVLELAAGTGIVSRRLRNALPDDCKLISTDLNAPMLEIARNKFQPGEAVSFEAMDATNLEYENEEFDAVACQGSVVFRGLSGFKTRGTLYIQCVGDLGKQQICPDYPRRSCIIFPRQSAWVLQGSVRLQ